jgi:flagellar biosynthesis protein FliR
MILAGFLVNLGLGALGRMVPAFLVFFLALPVQLLLALVVLELSFPATMALFGDALAQAVGSLDPGG